MASYNGHFRLTVTLASVYCAIYMPKLAQMLFNIHGATFAETYVDHIWFTP